MKKDRR